MIKFGIIGCGRIVKKHCDALKKIPNAKLVAVCDTDYDRMYRISNMYDSSGYLDYNEMLKNEKIDVVSILTPSYKHFEHVFMIAKTYKKNIICEKPMCLAYENAKKMIKVCNDNKVKLFVVKQNRYNLAIQALRKAFDTGRFGKINIVTVRVRWCRDQEYYNDGWHGDNDKGGNIIDNQLAHYLDMIQWFIGLPKRIEYSKWASHGVDSDIKTTLFAIMKYDNNLYCSIEGTTSTRPNDVEGSISILGEHGIAEVGGVAMNVIKQWAFKVRLEEDDILENEYGEIPDNIYGFGHVRYLENVVNYLSGNQKSSIDIPTNGSDAIGTVKFMSMLKIKLDKYLFL